MKRRIATLVVLTLLVLGALAIPASAAPGCQGFGHFVAGVAQSAPGTVGDAASGALPGTLPADINQTKDSNC